MKKILTFMCVMVLITALSISSVSAYVLPKGIGVSIEEGADFDSLLATEVYGYMGDADLNGKINIRDATLIQKSIANITSLSAEGEKLSDVDFSGVVNVRDATAIQKWLAGIEVMAPVYHALYATDDEAWIECLVGNWIGKINLAKELNEQIKAENVENMSFENVEVTVLMSFNEDGTYSIDVDESSIDATIKQVKSEYERMLTQYLEAFIKDNKLDTTVQDMMKLSGYDSISQMVEDIVPEQQIRDQLADIHCAGRYKVQNNGIYVSDSLDTEAELMKNGMYYYFSDVNLVIVSASSLMSDNLFPAEFTRA